MIRKMALRMCIHKSISARSYSSINPLTVNEKEVQKFSDLSNLWWDKSSSFLMLHQMNICRVEYILNQIKNNPELSQKLARKELKFLDVGCGGGLLSETLARSGNPVLGIDASVKNIGIANHHKTLDPLTNTEKLSYQNQTSRNILKQLKLTTIDDLVEKKGCESFDVVCSLEVIEHVNSPLEFVQSLANLVKPGGLVFISTLNRTLLSKILTINLAESLLDWAPKGTHDYAKYIKPAELELMLYQSGLQLVNQSGIMFNPLTNAWSLNNSLPIVNYIISSTKNKE